MDDLISRKDLMKKIAHHTVHDSMSVVTFERSTVYEMVKGDMFGLVKDAPAVDAIPRWISVEERLPDLFTNVLVIVKCKSNGEIQGIKISSRYTPIGCYHTEWRWGCSYNEEVTHWMPLPSTEGLHDN